MKKIWSLLFTMSLVCLSQLLVLEAYAEYRLVPRSYSGGVFLAHKRFVKKVVKASPAPAQAPKARSLEKKA